MFTIIVLKQITMERGQQSERFRFKEMMKKRYLTFQLALLFHALILSPMSINADPFIVKGSTVSEVNHTDNLFMLSRALLETGVSPLAYGAKGDGISDDTLAIQAVLSPGYKNIYFGDSRYRYKVNIPEGTALHTFKNILNP